MSLNFHSQIWRWYRSTRRFATLSVSHGSTSHWHAIQCCQIKVPPEFRVISILSIRIQLSRNFKFGLCHRLLWGSRLFWPWILSTQVNYLRVVVAPKIAMRPWGKTNSVGKSDIDKSKGMTSEVRKHPTAVPGRSSDRRGLKIYTTIEASNFDFLAQRACM